MIEAHPYSFSDHWILQHLRTLADYINYSAIPSSTSSLLKPSQSQIFNDIDSGNIDPSTFKSSLQSSKTLQSHSDLKSSASTNNMQHFKLASTIFSKAPLARPTQFVSALGQKRKASLITESTLASSERPNKALCSKRATPTISTNLPTFTAPAPAGRSPKSKRTGILSRRRVSARVDPPASGLGKYGLPSIDAALSGTLSSYKPKPAPSVTDYVPKGWQFTIHEETNDEQNAIILGQSTQPLDLSSDDESRVKGRDGRGKENIPPTDGLSAPVRSSTTAAVSRNDIMTDDIRSPLGVLNAADYYAAGCDIDSYYIVPAEGSSDSYAEKSNIENTYPSGPLTTADIDAVVAASATPAVNDGGLDIWESESAKAENEITV